MSDALSPDAAAEANREIREKLTELGVSDALVDKAEGISLWLQTHQPKLESAYSHCPCYRIDVANSLLCVGDVLLDEWQAEIVSALGSWSPSEARFTPAPHDPSCPPEFC
ncbi:MAG: hypothetical protein KDB07_08935, partial [Planctomycetes bacterium]|nr:hypothetical protein [Planctomycetota bacterium]